jgi:hypothetical protein
MSQRKFRTLKKEEMSKFVIHVRKHDLAPLLELAVVLLVLLVREKLLLSIDNDWRVLETCLFLTFFNVRTKLKFYNFLSSRAKNINFKFHLLVYFLHKSTSNNYTAGLTKEVKSVTPCCK